MREAGLEALSKGNKAAVWAQVEIMPAILLNGRELNMLQVNEGKEEISRRNFLKLAFAGVSGAVLLFLSGCLGGGEEDDDEDDGDDD